MNLKFTITLSAMKVLNDSDYHPDYGMPGAPWFGFSYIRPLWGYYAPFTFGRWDKYVPAGKYKPVSEYVYGNGLVSRSYYDERYDKIAKVSDLDVKYGLIFINPYIA